MPSTPAITPTLADIDGDGFLEIFASTTTVLYCISHTGEEIYAVDGHEEYKYSYQSPLVVDLDGEGTWCLIGACHGDNANHYVRNALTGEYREGWPKSVTNWTYSAPTVVKNGEKHAIFMGMSGEGDVFYQYDANGVVAPGFPLNLSSGIEGFVSVADIDGDGENEVITDFNLMEDDLGFIRAWEMDGTEITEGFPLRPQGLSYMNGANFGDIDGDGMLEIVTLTYVQTFSPDDPVYITAYALNQPVENLVYGTYKGSNDHMGWIREENEDPTSIQEIANEITVYPNPAQNTLHVEGTCVLHVDVFNILGQSVLSLNEGFESISLNALQNGVYFVRIQTQEGENTVKLIINK
jgi:hypothetical protein